MGIGGHAVEAWAGNSFYREASGRGSSPSNRVKNPLGEFGRPLRTETKRKGRKKSKKGANP